MLNRQTVNGRPSVLIPLALCIASAVGCHRDARRPPTQAAAQTQLAAAVADGAVWATYTDPKRHFQFQYPAGWNINSEATPVIHYRLVFAAVNSAGLEHFVVKEVATSPNTMELNHGLMVNMLPPGVIYLDVAWWEGPGPPQAFGPGISEMEAIDLAGVPAASVHDAADDDLTTRTYEFIKWGHHWSIVLYQRAPYTPEQRATADRLVRSFRFATIPAGDPLWALGQARLLLPPEADPDQYTREGGSHEHYCRATSRSDGTVMVTFTKHLSGSSEQTWSYEVDPAGKVTSAKP